MSKKYAIIVAGGIGKRMNVSLPKQFIPLAGTPILIHTISKFYQADKNIELIVVLPTEHITYWTNLCQEYYFNIPHKIVEGGETRFQSVKNGLNHIHEEGLVAVHDAVRPLVSNELIKKVFEVTLEKVNAVPAIAVNDSLRRVKGPINHALERDLYRIIQTPQCFPVSLLKRAYMQDFDERFTDDASVFESLGIPINLVEGESTNIKITSAYDLLIAEAIYKKLTPLS